MKIVCDLGSKRDSIWSDDRVKNLISLWWAGVSASDIGHRLGGLSKGTILGKVYRLRAKGFDMDRQKGR